ncbi:cupredoxin family protein [Ponticaulis sp.]|uniref:cupredoxin domain-containing protein n=1 Tax=Ponticaulis sp. TaxID=2020902 RepID=UPI000C35C0A0|nr:cupredoxin family protein [Ponticaulis sp.]MAF58587.1 copper oxidase [Ponticaulis sp.]MBN02967.1 copper oxidase [Ponticaulis sp.]
MTKFPKRLLLATAAIGLLAACGEGEAGDDHAMHGVDHSETMPVAGQLGATATALGVPAEPGEATRTIEVSMRETENGRMIFVPGSIEVTEGETIRFALVNDGQIAHEFVLGTEEDNAKHKAEMEAMSKMHKHNSPKSMTLEPGETGELAWTFTNAGTFEFACLIPGHYEAGMFGPLMVRG